jgi:hypothetical protein
VGQAGPVRRVGWQAGLTGMAFVMAALVAAHPSAQAPVTASDIQQLHDNVFEAATDLARLRTGDALLLKGLRATLDGIRDEIIYSKVKLRKIGTVSPEAYAAIRS